MENSFRFLTDQANSILIVIPTKPFFDQVAGALALYLTLRETKDVSIVSPTPMTVEFNRLIGVNKISHDLGNKNLLIKFAGYEASNIERVSYDIENRQFQLTVIPKTKFKAPLKEQIEVSYSGFATDLIILVGGANESHFPILTSKDVENSKIIHMGTRDIASSASNKIISLDRPASCDSELVASFIIDGQFKIDMDTATDLLMGIEEGSMNYTAPGVSAQTFEVVSHLMKSGGTRLSQNMAQIRSSDFPLGSIPGQSLRPMPTPQRVPMTQPVQNQVEVATNDNDVTQTEEVPDEWLTEPKIYKGTSTN